MKTISNIIKLILFFCFFLLVLVVISFKIQRGVFYYLAQQVGAAPEFDYISGTGSMYPTFPQGKGKTDLQRSQEIVAGHKTRKYPGGIVLFGKRYFGYTLKHGDIVFFNNEATSNIIAKETSSSAELNTGFVKRLIALPGDIIEIRDGFVLLNNEKIPEPYIAKARSTYGGNFLSDCRPLKIPPDYVFVMGDNRKESNDSRFDVGFVADSDIKTVIPIDEQDDLKKTWRDISGDNSLANKPVFDVNEYLRLLNEKRELAGVQTLKYEKKLEVSAGLRADVILKYNDLSFEATKSGYTMKNALDDAGYQNTIWGETPTLGYFEADELLNNYLTFPESRKFLLKPEFSDTGISARVGEINGCPVQVVVQHLAGYIPPNYPPQAADNWKKLIDNLNNVIPSWEKAKGLESVNQDDLNKLLGLLYQREHNAEIIYNKIKQNAWLNQEEEAMVNGDNQLYAEITTLIDKLNQK